MLLAYWAVRGPVAGGGGRQGEAAADGQQSRVQQTPEHALAVLLRLEDRLGQEHPHQRFCCPNPLSLC